MHATVSDSHLRRRALAFLVALFLLSLPATTTRIYATDEIQYFSYLRSLWFDHDVSFDNEYRHFYDEMPGRLPGFHETQLENVTATGLRINFGTMGSAILWAPFYAAADLGVRIARAFGSTVPADGYSWPYVAAVAYGSAVYGFLALLLSFATAVRIGVPTQSSVLATLAIWFGTPLLFYMYVAPVMAHGTSAFAVALFVAVWLAVRERWTPAGAAALGAAGALMVMVREQDVAYIAGPALDFIDAFLRAPSRRRPALAVPVLTGGAAFALVFTPQALAYLALYDRIGPSPLVGRKMDWTSPHAFQVLLSPEHGFFFWTPIAVLASAGLLMFAARLWAGGPAWTVSRTRGLALGLLAMLAGQIHVLGAVASWTSAGAFGQRRFVSATVLLVIGLAALIERVRGRVPRVALGTVAAVCVWWNLALIAQFGAGLMDRQRLELGRNAYDAFVTIPSMAPRLAYRYLFDRASFYRPAGDPPTR